MARGINKVILVGNLGGDPELRYTGGGTAVCQLRVATAETWNDKQSGQRQERTEWHRVVLFGKLGEIAQEYLRKGRQVYIEGSLRTKEYTDKEGIKRFTTEVIATDMQMLSGDGGSSGNRQQPGNSRGRGQQANQRGHAQQHEPPPDQGAPPFDDDDIPF
ncbi:single-stranded DNA-binding protein [Frateuria aurantia]|uniref:Single-stranded DNA-binding protein n=1 Tax=Frateuria aurantia (strain ATCC 33424 / DSM 6220 / KCTC 2777 / LMG 1558 / NBRC 3245 / NCIMB 13370) TaxID=767434 RepID=H8L1R7_FRAAD|nr:single-stranded DNA-binding protein [Frateuria aurantia]AFC85427.1 single stranded DNA-binding protein [Frateuria aurantia DSM 6220]